MPSGVYRREIGINCGYNNGKHWKIKDTSNMHHTAWNRGVSFSEESKIKMSLSQTGLKRPQSAEHKRRISESVKGFKHTEEAKIKISLSHKGKPTWNKGKIGIIPSTETRKKMSIAHINNPNRKFKDTSIELKMEAELKKRNINYQKQVPLCKIAIVDFYLPEDMIVIQCDGDYWHNRPERKANDIKQDRVLIFNGFNVYRFWEHEINESVENCINRVLK